MSDFIFGNNNQSIIKHLSRKSFSANKRRNIFVAIALALTAFMITAVFSIGFSYVETYQMQQLRLMGTTADVAITNLNEEQWEQIKSDDLSDLISDIGTSQRLGSVDTSDMENALLGVVWIDETEWKTHRLPTITGVKGDYPIASNEIMLPTWVLEQMGIDTPELGMNISLTYKLENAENYITELFTLSGYYTDYVYIRADNKGPVYVSEAFRNSANLPLDNGGSAMISFINDEDVEKNCEKLMNEIGFSDVLNFEIVPSSQGDNSTIILAIGMVIFFIAFSGYLLIYNILYISVSRDIRFYGQLKTLGTTKKQIKKIVLRQVLRMSAIGIPIGLLLGAAVSYGIVPYALNMMYASNSDIGTKVSFSPLIFIGAALFTLLTAVIGSMKPAKIAGNISPIAALQFTETRSSEKQIKRNKKGVRLSRMAWQNIFRNKKSAALVFASLFLGLTLFLLTTGILSSLSPENFVKQWGRSDFVISYDIYSENTAIPQSTVSEVSEIEGVQNIHLTHISATSAVFDVAYDEAVFGDYIRSFADNPEVKSGIDFSNPDEVKAYTQNFYGGVYGIETYYVQELNKTLDTPIDLERFENGEIVLLSETLNNEGENLFQPGQSITVISSQTEQHSYEIAGGFLSADFQSGRGNMRGTAPDMFISINALQNLSSDSKIYRVDFDTNGTNDDIILLKLKTITSSQTGINIVSRYEKALEIGDYLTTTKILSMGLSIVLLLIGVLNFVNTMVVSVNTRRHELALLESVGMTKTQIKKMLIYEGCYYWFLSFLATATLGTGLFLTLYYVFKQAVYYATFTYPIFPLAFIAVIVLAVCFIVPIKTYLLDVKKSIVVRLREAE